MESPNNGKRQWKRRGRRRKSPYADLRINVLKNEIQFVGAKVFKEMRWLNLLIAELMHVDTEVERELLEELIAKSRCGIREMEAKSIRYLKVIESIERDTAAPETLLSNEEMDYLKSVKLKRGRKPAAFKHYYAALAEANGSS